MDVCYFLVCNETNTLQLYGTTHALHHNVTTSVAHCLNADMIWLPKFINTTPTNTYTLYVTETDYCELQRVMSLSYVYFQALLCIQVEQNSLRADTTTTM